MDLDLVDCIPKSKPITGTDRAIQNKIADHDLTAPSKPQGHSHDGGRHQEQGGNTSVGELAEPCSNPEKYRSIVGKLNYVSGATSPDITYAVSFLCRFMAHPLVHHWNIMVRTLKYIKGTLDYKLHLGEVALDQSIVGYSDSDYACDADRKSTTGYCFFVYNGLVSWKSKKQVTVTTSTCEAEYMALSDAAKEGIWTRMFVSALKQPHDINAVLLYGDNYGSLQTTNAHSHHKRMKHIDIKYHFIREKIQEKKIQVSHVSTHHQIADIFTKPLTKIKFEDFRKQLGVF